MIRHCQKLRHYCLYFQRIEDETILVMLCYAEGWGFWQGKWLISALVQ